MEEKARVMNHKMIVEGRGRVTLSGVLDVNSFDAKEVHLRTELGMLMIKGEELHVNRLTLEKGEVDLDGKIDSLVYSDKGAGAGNEETFLKRLFR